MRLYPVLFLAVGLALSACGETSGPSTGTLAVSTATAGDDPDLDGYLLTVDGVDSLALDPAGTAEIDLPGGPHTLKLLGVAEQCSVAPATSLAVDVPPQSTTPVAFEISCPATGARVTVTTTGLDIPGGYRVGMDGTDRGAISANGTLYTRLEPGSRTITLTGLAPNCAVGGPGSSTVTVVAAQVAPIEFAVVCTATSGVVGVVVNASGPDAEGLNEAMVDGVLRFLFPAGPGLPAYVVVSAGDHIISLVHPPANCSVDTSPQSVSVTGGGLVRDTVGVTFSVSCVPNEGTLRITAPTTGPLPSGRYRVYSCPSSDDPYICPYDASPLGSLAPNHTLTVQTRASIVQSLFLLNIPLNCRGGYPTTITAVVTFGDTLDVVLPVDCVP